MVLRYVVIGVGILFAYDIRSVNLDTLLTNMQNPKEGAVQESTAVGPVPPQVSNQPVALTPKLPEAPILPKPMPVEPKLPVPPQVSNQSVALTPKLPEAPILPKPMPVMPQAKPIQIPAVTMAPKLPTPVQIPAVTMAPKLPTPAPIVQPFAKPTVTAAQSTSPAATVQETAEVNSEGLDTLNIDTGGNWLEKRVWYQKAEREYEEIHKLMQKTSDIRTKFVHEVSVIGKHIDDFYEKVSFEKGQIDELLQAVLGSLTTEQKIRGGDLSSDERDIKEKIHADQQAFQSIEATMKSITDLDEQVSKTMIKAFQEIDACNALEAKAWNNFKEIGTILDDKKARVLFYEIENFYKNIEKKIDYLQSNLLSYLQNQLNAKITQQTSQIQATVNSLKTKGLEMQTLLEKDMNGDFVIFKQREEQKAKEAEAKLAESQAKAQEAKHLEKKSTQEAPWYENIWCMIQQYLCPILIKLSEWASIVWCCIQTLLCKIQEMICRLLGY
jgi:hypothetical protein